jgi:hypothetical protein
VITNASVSGTATIGTVSATNVTATTASITTLFGLGCLSSLLQKKIPNEIIY